MNVANKLRTLPITANDASALFKAEESSLNEMMVESELEDDLFDLEEPDVLELRMKQKEKYRKVRKGKRVSPRDHKGVLHAAPAKHSAYVEDYLSKKKKQFTDAKRDERQTLNEIAVSYVKSPSTKKVLPWDDICTVVNVFREISYKYQENFSIAYDSQCSLEAMENYLESSIIRIAYNANRIEQGTQNPISGFCLIVPEDLFYITEDDVVRSALHDTVKYLWNLL